MAETLRNTLIRAYSMDMRRNHGNVVVAEILFRRVDFAIHGHTGNVPGAVLIDAAAALGQLGRAVGMGVGFLVFIQETDQLLWIATRADLLAGDYWTIEMIPWTDYLRANAPTDAEVIRGAHQP